MNKYYDIMFLTTMPSFYKVNLFNEIAKERNILVVYTGSSEGMRSPDFSSTRAEYEAYKLDKRFLFAIIQLIKLVITTSFSKAIISGWDNIMSFVVVLLHKKSHNGCIIESSIYESSTEGLKARMKRILLNRVSKVYASGIAQRQLAEALGFKGEIIEFGGCGLLNYRPQPPYEPRETVKHFLYVGRLATVKNLELLIAVFNDNPRLDLTVIGDGPLRTDLEKTAFPNIHFLGAINNKDLPNYYKNSDVFVLPSRSEPWGLVVEEALNNGCPVIVSSTVGCAESLVAPYSSGLVFESESRESLSRAIERICDVEYYNRIRNNVSALDFMERGKKQVRAFLNE